MRARSGLLLSLALLLSAPAVAFEIEEATIDDIQAAIRKGEVTCKGVVEA